MKTVTSKDLAAMLRDPAQVTARRFLFAFKSQPNRASHIIVGTLGTSWRVGNEVRYAVSVPGPDEGPYHYLVLSDQDTVAIRDERAVRHDGWFDLVRGNLVVLWARFSSLVPPKLWERLPVGSALDVVGRNFTFTPEGEPKVRGLVVGMRSLPDDAKSCHVTIRIPEQPKTVDAVMNEEGNWRLFAPGETPVRGIAMFG